MFNEGECKYEQIRCDEKIEAILKGYHLALEELIYYHSLLESREVTINGLNSDPDHQMKQVSHQSMLDSTNNSHEEWLSIQAKLFPNCELSAKCMTSLCVNISGILATCSFAKLAWDDADNLAMSILLALTSGFTNGPMSIFYGFAFFTSLIEAIENIKQSDCPVWMSLLMLACFLMAFEPALSGISLGKEAWEDDIEGWYWAGGIGLALNYLFTRTLGLIKQIVNIQKSCSPEAEIQMTLNLLDKKANVSGYALSDIISKANKHLDTNESRLWKSIPLCNNPSIKNRIKYAITSVCDSLFKSCLNSVLAFITFNCILLVWQRKSKEGWQDIHGVFNWLPADWSNASGWLGGGVHTYFYVYVIGLRLVDSLVNKLPVIARGLCDRKNGLFSLKIFAVLSIVSSLPSGAAMAQAAKGVPPVLMKDLISIFNDDLVFTAVSAVNLDAVIRFFEPFFRDLESKIEAEIEERCMQTIVAAHQYSIDDPRAEPERISGKAQDKFFTKIPSKVRDVITTHASLIQDGVGPNGNISDLGNNNSILYNSSDACWALTFLSKCRDRKMFKNVLERHEILLGSPA